MPFVQRVVQPINLAQATAGGGGGGGGGGGASASGKTIKFLCIPGKCHNNNCIGKQVSGGEQRVIGESTAREQSIAGEASRTYPSSVKDNFTSTIAIETTTAIATPTVTPTKSAPTVTPTFTKAIIHANGTADDVVVVDHAACLSNGFGASFSYATDTEDDALLHAPLSPALPCAEVLPMKKLKQHVEFLSTVPSPTRSQARGSDTTSTRFASSAGTSTPAHRRQPAAAAGTVAGATSVPPATPQSPTAAKIIAGYEFDSISNLTLSNALRQLASLVLIASDIFDDLQRELQTVGDRARTVQRKIVAVERRVSAYDPKMVTVPESDLLTFAQRKIHYESDKAVRKELFTADSRPRSVRALYEEAGKVPPPPPPAPAPSTSSSSAAAISSPFASGSGMADILDMGCTGGDELVCTPLFGKANRKMRTRIDAEIEIRLPAAIEELRKWTSAEALGDVTVTPDCMHHVDTSISTSLVIGDNGVLTPALSPSVLSADAVDALYSIHVNNAVDNTQLPNDINQDVPLNHRLPSPEEQLKIIALRYPAEVISVDISGKRFQRMCLARKSTTGCFSNVPETNNLNEDVQTVSRRSRSRKVRGKRRNTIAGIDQKEIQDAANGDSTAAKRELKTAAGTAAGDDGRAAGSRGRSEKAKKFGRSKSSDLLKKDSAALPFDKGKSTLTRLNSLKLWGRNRFKFMQRHSELPAAPLATINSSAESNDLNSSSSSAHNTSADRAAELNSASGSASNCSTKTASTAKMEKLPSTDMEDEGEGEGEAGPRTGEGRFSHERKPSYSSSEKSVSVGSGGQLRGRLHAAPSCGNVKMRDTSSLNRQRRHGGLGAPGSAKDAKDEQPHSSSGNWSASSESGRASIGSEITIQPKSSASNTSLNASSLQAGSGSGPPSSMLGRRRFLNTSASSSVTSDGTATPDLQMGPAGGCGGCGGGGGGGGDGSYPNHLDDETSSAYSCDTEGYYTSFHMDSGLRTLKEEDMAGVGGLALGQGGQGLHGSGNAGSQSQQTLVAENEYELFGRGSTSTTTSSAGTVCTALLAHHSGTEQGSLNASLSGGCGPEVPERISSLRNSVSSGTLERSISSSTIGSTLERTGTIKRNGNGSEQLAAAAVGEAHDDDELKPSATTPESQEEEDEEEEEEEFSYAQQIRRRAAKVLPAAEVECSECSDLEGVERIERLKQKTAITAKRIPSMCIITPTTSDDDESHHQPHEGSKREAGGDEGGEGGEGDEELPFDPDRTLTYDQSSPGSRAAAKAAKKASGQERDAASSQRHAADGSVSVLKRNSVGLSGFNTMLEKLKVVLPNMKRSPSKLPAATAVDEDELYDAAGEYVYIAGIATTTTTNNNSNNNRQWHHQKQNPLPAVPRASGSSSLAIYYSNDELRRRREATREYVSLNELPHQLRGGCGGCGGKKRPLATNGAAAEGRSGACECADSLSERRDESDRVASSLPPVPMYAEIGELRAAASALAATPAASPPVSPHKGARVRLNAAGRPIYDSDSLKRRRGAHTTFAPGPYVKEVNDSCGTAGAAVGESGTLAAKLLLLNAGGSGSGSGGGIGAARPAANERPVIVKSPLTRPLPSTPSASAAPERPLPTSSSSAAPGPEDRNRHLLVRRTNPSHCPQSSQQPPMLHSPSTKSTASSTGSTISSSASSSSSASASSKDEGYQRFYRADDGALRREPTPMQPTANGDQSDPERPFQRSAPIYWTLQNRRPLKAPPNGMTSCDDLYAIPIRRSERAARAAATATATATATAVAATAASMTSVNGAADLDVPRKAGSLSPIGPRNRNPFLTSTPTRGSPDSAQQRPTPLAARNGHGHWDDPNSAERLNTCADRAGHSRTSLLDFKKLLLAKSAKSSPVQRKVSAVEMLKKPISAPITDKAALPSAVANGTTLNSSLKLLDLSGSPKAFASRRMLRQGQFGSPSKTFSPKTKASPSPWRNNAVQRTDIMSTTIPEANSEEDQTNSSAGSGGVRSGSEQSTVLGEQQDHLSSTERYNLKRNFFLQTEENNFMRGELRSGFGKATTTTTTTTVGMGNKGAVGADAVGADGPSLKSVCSDRSADYCGSTSNGLAAVVPSLHRAPPSPLAAMPALETAL